MAISSHSRFIRTPASRRALSCVLTLALACSLTASAQNASQNSLTAANAAAQSAPTAFSTRPTAEYTLGAGDQVRINLVGRDDMNLEVALGPDGRITLPIAGTVELGGMTRDQATRAIQSALAKYYISPVVLLTVTHYAADTVLLLGAVAHPGLETFDHQPTLLEALARAGVGSTENLPPDIVTTTTSTHSDTNSSLPEHALIYRGSNQMAEVDLKKLLTGQSFSDVYLQRGDVVLVPVVNELVSVLGAVRNPGAIPFAAQNSLAVLIAQAGGLDDKAGGDPLIRIINPERNSVEEVHFKELLNPGGPRVTLHAGDVIFVPTSTFGKFAYVFDKLNPITTALTIGLAYQSF